MDTSRRRMPTARPGIAGEPTGFYTARTRLMKLKPKRTRQYLTDTQKKELQDAFELFDLEKTGKIGYHEVKVLMKALGYPTKKAEVVQLVNKHDKEGNGLVTLDMFIEIMTEKILARDPDDDLREAFTLFDEDMGGKITLKNMRRIAKELGEDVPDEELQAMIDEFDLNQDGGIDEQEFFAIMKSED